MCCDSNQLGKIDQLGPLVQLDRQGQLGQLDKQGHTGRARLTDAEAGIPALGYHGRFKPKAMDPLDTRSEHRFFKTSRRNLIGSFAVAQVAFRR
jgi:hypothetical protein